MRGVFQQAGIFVAVAMSAVLPGHESLAQTSNDKLNLPAAPAAQEVIKKSKVIDNFKFEDTSGITDIRLKAERGSMSRYSGKFSFGYEGPVIDDLSNPYQPDPDHSITHNPTKLRGSISFRYRRSADSAVNLGTGVSRVTPFSDDARTDVNTPFISYDHSHRVKAYQLRESIEGSMITNPEMLNVGEYGSIGAGFAILRNINYSRWEVGVDFNLQYGLYRRPYDPGPAPAAQLPPTTTTALAAKPGGRRGGGRVGIASLQDDVQGDRNASQFTLGFSPTVRFRISDKVGSFTSVHFGYQEPRSALGQIQLTSRTVSQRAGIDVAITKSIFFSPFLTFYPQALSMSTTAANFSTIFSIF